MDHLREESRDVAGNLVLEGAGHALPDAVGSDEHGATPLSSARATNSSSASRVNLLTIPSRRPGARLVAATGSLSHMRS